MAPLLTLGTRDRAGAAAGAQPPIRLAVSTYSYWHFTPEKYPIEKVIEKAAAIGFEGVEILHRQMKDETPAYVNGLKRTAFLHGLSFPMLSIHQDFVDPDRAKRQEAIDHTTHCIWPPTRSSSRPRPTTAAASGTPWISTTSGSPASSASTTSRAGSRWRWRVRRTRTPPSPRATRCCARPSPERCEADTDRARRRDPCIGGGRARRLAPGPH